MHPLLKTPRALAAYLAAWLFAGLVFAAAWVQQASAQWLWGLAFWLPMALVTGAAALSVYYVCRSAPLRPATWLGSWLRRAAAAVFLALAVSAIAALWNLSGNLFGRAALVEFSSAAWLAFIGLQAVVFVLSAAMHDAVLAHQAAQAAAATETQARLLAREMEIKALHNRIDPHFLFNSLNSISALTQIDAGAARAMIIDLAQFFRQTLAVSDRERIGLAEELELVQRYLAIEQRRLGDKLGLQLEVDPAALAARLPPLVLQPLVENAIKHGIRPLDQGGQILVRAERSGQRLLLRVSNPVEPTAAHDASGLGQGLGQLRARLQAHYDAHHDAHDGESAFVDVERSEDKFTVDISLPWQT